MSKRILIECSAAQRTRVAVTQKNELIEYDEASPQTYIRTKNTIYNATIKSIRPELGAAFVQYVESNGDNIKDGFLPFSNIASRYFSNPEAVVEESEIAKQIRVGQKILVQIKKDQLHHESKGAALTTFISLAGTYLVLLPLNQKQGISRKADLHQRDHIREILKNLNVSEEMGIIIRTAGISAKAEEIEWDYKALLQQWHLIQEAHQSQQAPCLIHEDENIVTRIIRDNMSHNTEKIICNHKETYLNIQQYLQTIRPEYIENNILEFYDHELMFDHYTLEDKIEEIFQVRCSLPSGGQIVMHGTEAGYMIDVNSSKSTYGRNVEENALNTNKEAAVKIADMLRLRDVSGIINIDFIDMNEEENRKIIEKTFTDRATIDRAKVKTEPISLLTGCMPVLRQGLGTVFFKSSLEPVEHDETVIIGKRRSVVSYANYILSILEKSATQKTDIIQIQLPIDVSTYLLNEMRASIHHIEKSHQVAIKIIPNENFSYRRYILKRFHNDDAEAKTQSHQLIAQGAEEKAWIAQPRNQKPHVARTANKKTEQKQSSTSVISTLWGFLTGSSEKTTEKKRSNRRPTKSTHRSRRQDGDARRRHEKRNEQQRSNRTEKVEKNFNTIQESETTNDSEASSPNGNRTQRRRSNSHLRTRKSRSSRSQTSPVGNFDDD